MYRITYTVGCVQPGIFYVARLDWELIGAVLQAMHRAYFVYTEPKLGDCITVETWEQ